MQKFYPQTFPLQAIEWLLHQKIIILEFGTIGEKKVIAEINTEQNELKEAFLVLMVKNSKHFKI